MGNDTALTRKTYGYSSEEMDNLSNNILKKMAKLGVTLPELAKIMGVNYHTLLRITNQKESYSPNLRALLPIADFFHVTVADLLKNPNLPQYVPLLNVGDVEDYLLNQTALNNQDSEKIFCNEYIHEKAFALNIQHPYLGGSLKTVYICKPRNKISNCSHIFFKYEKTKYFFVKVLSIESDVVNCIEIQSDTHVKFNLNSMDILAVAIKQIVDNDLL